MEYYSAIQKNEILLFAATQMDLESIMLSDIRQRKTNAVWYHLYVESKKYSILVNATKKNQIQGYREQTNSYEWAKGEEQNRDRDLRVPKN